MQYQELTELLDETIKFEIKQNLHAYEFNQDDLKLFVKSLMQHILEVIEVFLINDSELQSNYEHLFDKVKPDFYADEGPKFIPEGLQNTAQTETGHALYMALQIGVNTQLQILRLEIEKIFFEYFNQMNANNRINEFINGRKSTKNLLDSGVTESDKPK